MFASLFAWAPSSSLERGIPIRGQLWVGAITNAAGIFFAPMAGTPNITTLIRFGGSNTVTVRLYINEVLASTVTESTVAGPNIFDHGPQTLALYDRIAITGDGSSTITTTQGQHILEY